jgi:putative intracellular protease/amidase
MMSLHDFGSALVALLVTSTVLAQQNAADDLSDVLSAPDIAGSILMVVTSHGEMDDGDATGLWLEEFAIPHTMFSYAGYTVTVASPLGGKTPVDPRSLSEDDAFDEHSLLALEDTVRLANVNLDAYDAVFFPGGHGTMFDLPENDSVHVTVAHFVAKDQPAAFVCHGPAALVGATLPDDEERAVELDEAMPFLLETRLRELGAKFAGIDNFQEHVVVDGNLITGQNPASSEQAARALLDALKADSLRR